MVNSLQVGGAVCQPNFSRFVNSPATWLITGVAGFIGSNLLETLLINGQYVVGMDNFSTGYKHNLEQVRDVVGDVVWEKFRFIEGDIRDISMCQKACVDVDFVLHHAALASVPESIADPLTTNAVNIEGFLNVLIAARSAKVKRFIFASSSSVYGSQTSTPLAEITVGHLLSPYAISKYVNELYAGMFANTYNFEIIGLRYFNVYGKRQSVSGTYSAVIPKWVSEILNNKQICIYGDGETSRDFCYVDDVVRANLLAALTSNAKALNQIINIASGTSCTLNMLFNSLNSIASNRSLPYSFHEPMYLDFRVGDIRFSSADITKAKTLLEYVPQYAVIDGLSETMDWYLKNSNVTAIQ
jgi:UDP-N-acetylglucosamine 4-epimerase